MNDKIQLHNQNNNLPDLRFVNSQYIIWAGLVFLHLLPTFPISLQPGLFVLSNTSRFDSSFYNSALSPKIEINSALAVDTASGVPNYISLGKHWFLSGAKPYFHLFAAPVFSFAVKAQHYSGGKAGGANVRPEMEFSIMAIEETRRLPAGYTTAAKLCVSTTQTFCHFFFGS